MNSWYLGAFFFANGATVFGPNGNDAAAGVVFGEDNGAASLEAVLSMVSNPNYRTDDAGLGKSGLMSGEVSAYFSGSWDYDNFSGTVGTNVSGTSDLAPLDKQAAMVKKWFPEAKTVGLLYCSAEANSQYQVDTVQAELEKLGLTCTQYPFSDTNDMASVTQSAVDNSDVLYVPTDNTCANNAGIIDNIARPAGVPIIAGEEGICGGCGVATLSISYYDLGVATGKMAAKILTGEADIAEMPIEYAPQFTKKYNETICTDLGLTVPEGYEAIA